MIRIPLANLFDLLPLAQDDRLEWDESYSRWVKAKAPRLPIEPPAPIPDDGFLRRVRADG